MSVCNVEDEAINEKHLGAEKETPWKHPGINRSVCAQKDGVRVIDHITHRSTVGLIASD